MDPQGIITTIAGTDANNPAHTGDGGLAKDARLQFPNGIAVAPDGSVYFTESPAGPGSSGYLRRITPDGTIQTIVGGGPIAYPNGERGERVGIWRPWAVTVARDGTVYLVDDEIPRVLKVTPSGAVYTIARYDSTPSKADQPLATPLLRQPTGVALAPDGALYVTRASA